MALNLIYRVVGLAMAFAAQECVANPLNGLLPEQIELFDRAREVFQEVEDVPGGLGPRFNLNSCVGCHAHPAVGGSTPAVNPQVTVAKELGASNIVPSFITPTGPAREVRFVGDGRVHDIYTIAGRFDAPGCALAQPDFAAQPITFRIPTPLFGGGLVENTSDATLMADVAFVAQRRALLGISGHFNHIGESIARFGWKAQHKSLRDFSGEAYAVEMGVTNELFPVELDQDAGCQFNAVPESLDDVEQFTIFMTLLAPLQPASPTLTTERGKFVFDASGCNLCHIERHKTTGSGTIAALVNITYAPFSDFQLHRMGTLGDGITQGEAAGDEFRTAPLWGVGQRLFFLHDGRTADLSEAIQAHASPNSEATASTALFNAFSDADKQALIAFLKSL